MGSQGSYTAMTRLQNSLTLIQQLSGAPAPDGWERVDKIANTNAVRRVVAYGSISLLLLSIGVSFFVFQFDVLKELDALADQVGSNAAFGVLIGSILLMLPLHEILHAVSHPDRGRTYRTVFGTNFVSMYSLYLAEMNIERFLVVLLAPVVTISGILLVFVILLPQWKVVALILSVVNLGMSLSDLAMFVRASRIRRTHSKIWNRGSHFIAFKRQ